MKRRPYTRIADGSKKVRLDKIDPADTAGIEKADALTRIEKLGVELSELENLLTYAGTHALLIVLQGRDASGKDGAARKILEFTNVQNALRVPVQGAVGGRERPRLSVARPQGRSPPKLHGDLQSLALRRRDRRARPQAGGQVDLEGALRAHQRVRAAARGLDVILLKFYLHISPDEQYERLMAREKDPRTAWKLNPADWKEVPLWDEVSDAYQDAIDRCASPDAPWYLVPADKKWFRNLAVMQRLVLALRPYRKIWLRTLKKMAKSKLKEIR